MLEKILKNFFGKVPVTEKSVKEASNTLRETLRNKGFVSIDRLPDAAVSSIVAEALRKASAQERDGVARVGVFCTQIEWAADNVIAAFSGAADADQRIKSVLAFHNLP
jgi:hypothetical protein